MHVFEILATPRGRDKQERMVIDADRSVRSELLTEVYVLAYNMDAEGSIWNPVTVHTDSISIYDEGPAGKDGTAHMAVYVDHHSFIWNGSSAIYISYGGYGEPVTDVIPAPPRFSHMSAAFCFNMLRSIANNYINRKGQEDD